MRIGAGENRLRGCYLLEKGALNMVKPVSDKFLSSLFLVLKRDGKSRPVINLKELNVFLKYEHFKMEGIHLLRDLLQPQDWLGKIDLKDAYFVIPIWKDHRKYFRFFWKGSLLEFACLPFGLAVAPRLFTKVLKPVVALLRRAGIRLIIYLDDLLFMNQSKEGNNNNNNNNIYFNTIEFTAIADVVVHLTI